MISKKWKLIIIGVDGLDWQLTQRFIQQGQLPNLQAWGRRGIAIKLHSTTPPISPVAWTTILSGLNPGKHGIFDWSIRKEGSYEFTVADSSYLKVPMLWDILAAQGLTMTAFNLPLTYPPLKINGQLVSGILTPDTDADFTYPRELAEELRTLSYRIGMQQTYTADSEAFYYQDLLGTLESRLEAIRHLLANHPQDIGIFLIAESDFAQHKFWKYTDPAGRPQADIPDDPVGEVCKRIDRFLGEITRSVGEDTDVVILSDHGFGGLKKVFLANAWLAEQGFLTARNNLSLRLRNSLNNSLSVSFLHHWAKRLGLGRHLANMPKQLRNNLVRGMLSFDDVDWKKTQAYASGALNQIYLNLKGREPQGCLDGSRRGEVLERIEQALGRLKDPLTGEKIKVECRRAEELYFGRQAEQAPDIHFIMDDYSYISSKRLFFRSRRVFSDSEYEDSGTHRPYGVFFASGPHLTPVASQTEEAQIEALEVLPSLLYLIGAQIPDHLDGRINPLVAKAGKAARPSYFSMPLAPDNNKGKKSRLTQAAEERLRGLGYID